VSAILALRNGLFVTPGRLRLWSAALLTGFCVAVVAIVATRHGLNDLNGRPLGADFSSFYSAGRLALGGHSPYDQRALFQAEQSLFGDSTQYYAFAYPPIFLLFAAPLALLPYPLALGLWEALGLAFYLLALLRLRRTLGLFRAEPSLVLIGALSFTATFVEIIHGQNAFLSAGLFALAISFLNANDAMAGVSFGILAFKPQLGLIVPFALAAAGRWRCMAFAALTVAALAALSAMAFGPSAWREFLATSEFAKRAILDEDAVGYSKMISIFGWLRIWGAPLGLAYAGQAAVGLAAISATAWLWRWNASPRVAGAALCLGALLVTPFAFDYDMLILAPALLLLSAEGLERGFRPYERLCLFALWLAPAASRTVAAHAHIPLAAPILLATFCLTLLRGVRSEGSPAAACP
jgi:hypothetical protein